MILHEDKEKREFLSFRKKSFDNKIKDLVALIDGTDSVLLPFIADEEQNIVEEKLDSFISELLSCIKLDKADEEDVKRYEFYECFLYCTIRSFINEKREGMDEYEEYIMMYPVLKFRDILDMVRDPLTYDVKSKEALIQMEYDAYQLCSRKTGLFNICDYSYKVLCGEDIMNTYSEEEKAGLVGPYDDIPWKEFESDPSSYEGDYDSTNTDENYEAYLDANPEERELEEWFDEYHGMVKSRRENWKANITSPEKFISKYMRYRELYFEVGRYRMVSDIENMIDTFLYNHKLSAFSLGDEYGKITYRLDSVKKVLENEMRKAGCDI